MTESQWCRFCKRYADKDTTAIVQLIKKIYEKEMSVSNTLAIQKAMEDEIKYVCDKEKDCVLCV